MIHGGALFWSVTLHAMAATSALMLAGEPSDRTPLAAISLFDATPLPILSEGTVLPIVDIPSRLIAPCPASSPPEHRPRLATLPDAAFVRPVSGCIRVGEDGTVNAVGVRRTATEADRRRLRSIAASIRFVPATRDGIRVPAWLGISVRRRTQAAPIRSVCDGGCI